MSEELKVGEPRPQYRASGSGPEESVLERVQIQFPPYFERFLDERDQRIAAEIHRLEAAVERNSQDIARVLREMDLRFDQVERRLAEMRAEVGQRFGEIDRRFGEMERRLAEMQAETDHRFAEAAEARQSLRAEMERRFGEVDRRFGEVDRRFAEMQAEMNRRFAEVDRRFTELVEGQKSLRAEMRTHFYWTIGLLFPVVASVVAIVIRLFFGGTP